MMLATQLKECKCLLEMLAKMSECNWHYQLIGCCILYTIQYNHLINDANYEGLFIAIGYEYILNVC